MYTEEVWIGSNSIGPILTVFHIREGTLLFPYGDNIIDTLIIKIHKIILRSRETGHKFIIVSLSITFIRILLQSNNKYQTSMIENAKHIQ